MSPTDTSEKGLESLIVEALIAPPTAPGASPADTSVHQPPSHYGGAGYLLGDPQDYDREHALDLAKLLAFLDATQPATIAQLGLAADGPKRREFLARLQGEIARRGVVDVLRRGVEHRAAHVDDQTAVDQLVERYLGGAARDQLDPILDACVATYLETLDEDAQVRTRPGAAEGDRRAARRSHRAIQAIQRQRILPPLARRPPSSPLPTNHRRHNSAGGER